MKKLFFYVIMSIVAVSAYADATITIPNVQIKSGKSAVLAVTLSGDQTRFSIGWDITLASGLTIKDKNDLKNGEIAPDLSPLINTAGAPVYKIGATSSTEWTASDGVLQYITIYDDGSHNVGDVLTCSIDNIELGNGVAAEALHPAGSTFNVTVVADVLDLYDNESVLPATSNNTENVIIHRNLKSENWNSFVVPFDMDATQIEEAFGAGAKVAELSTWDVNSFTVEDVTNISLGFTSVSEITANKPVIVWPTKGVTAEEGIKITGVNGINPAAALSKADCKKGRTTKSIYLTGVYVPTQLGGDVNDDSYANQIYLKSNNFYFADQNTSIKGYRAYIEMGDFYLPSLFEVKIFVDDDLTAINDVPVNRTNGKIYTIDGKYVGKDDNINRMQKGVYIVNGKKVIK